MMFLLTFLMPFSKYSQYPVVSRNSANDIKNVELQFLFSRHFERNEVESRNLIKKLFFYFRNKKIPIFAAQIQSGCGAVG